MDILNWIEFFLWSWGLPFTAYVLLQVLAALKLHGKARLLVLVPAPFMLIVVGITIYLFIQQSNLWPFFLIFTAPIAVLFVLITWSIATLKSRSNAT
jgi:hypothetical protein